MRTIRRQLPLRVARLTLALAPLLGLAAPLERAHAEDPGSGPPPEVRAVLEGLARQDREARQAAAEGAAGLTHPALLPALLKAVKDEYRSVREPVFRALAARGPAEERRKAARALEARLKDLDKQPETKDELLVLVQALHDLAQPTSIEPLIEGIDATSEVDVATARLRAVANVPSKDAVERLIQYAARGRRGESYRGAALKALEYATNVRLGSLDAWHRWWAENKRSFDPDAAARVRAEEREAAQAKAREREERRQRGAEGRGEKAPDGQAPKAPEDGQPVPPGSGGS
jgi:HEAT repeat protein